MKKNKLYIMATIFAAAMLSFSSCKKDALTDSKDNVLIYMPQARETVKGLQVYPLIDAARTQVLSASYGGDKYPADDIAVTFEISQAAFDKRNAERVAAGLPPYLPFPADAYSIDKLSGVIKKGELASSDVIITYFPKKFNSQKDYLLPITIKDAAGFAVNPDLKTTFLVVEKLEIKAGTYASDGVRTNHNPDGSVNGALSPYTPDKVLTRYIDPLDPAVLQFDIDAVANLAAGRAGTIFRVKINPDLTVTVYGQLDNAGQPISSAPGKQNYYDPTTKSFILNYRYTLTTGAYRQMEEKLTRK